jgi:ATP-dependent helicase Lhr and Lhr-like helicase
VLAATDPAQPYGAALPWPESAGPPARAIGAYVVWSTAACAYLERGGKRLLTFPAAAEHPEWPRSSAASSIRPAGAPAAIETIDGEPAATSPWADALRAAGFADGYKGLTRGG